MRRHILALDIGPVWNGGLKLLQGLWLSLVGKEIQLEGKKTYALIMALKKKCKEPGYLMALLGP